MVDAFGLLLQCEAFARERTNIRDLGFGDWPSAMFLVKGEVANRDRVRDFGELWNPVRRAEDHGSYSLLIAEVISEEGS